MKSECNKKLLSNDGKLVRLLADKCMLLFISKEQHKFPTLMNKKKEKQLHNNKFRFRQIDDETK